MPRVRGSGPHSVRGRICSQVAKLLLPAELGRGAEAGLRAAQRQPQECGSQTLPWQSRQSQSVRMCGWEGGESDRGGAAWWGGGCVSAVDSCVGEDDSSLFI